MPDEQPLHRSSTTRSTLSDGAAPIHARAYEWYTSLHEQRVAYSIKRIPGTVPVEADGSAFFEVPAMRSLFFVALDERGMSVKRIQPLRNQDESKTEISTRLPPSNSTGSRSGGNRRGTMNAFLDAVFVS